MNNDKKAVKKPLEEPKAEVVKLEDVHNKEGNNGNHKGWDNSKNPHYGEDKNNR